MKEAAAPKGLTGALSPTASVRLGPMFARFSCSSETLAIFSATSVAASGPLIAPALVAGVGDAGPGVADVVVYAAADAVVAADAAIAVTVTGIAAATAAAVIVINCGGGRH